MRFRSPAGLLVFGLGFALAVSAQQLSPQAPQSDPQAATLAAGSGARLTGGNAISDVSLTATVHHIAGSLNETGTATLKALGTSQSRLDLVLPSGTLSEVRNSSTGIPACEWIGPDGAVHATAQHNCWTDPGWFFPALSSLTQGSNANVVFSYVGQETRGGASVQHLRSYLYLAGAKPIAISEVQRLSAIDFYLDSTTLLPVAIDFKAHPDNDEIAEIAVEIVLSDYRAINGVLVPFHIQKFINNGLVFDISVTSVSLNSGLSASVFAIQ